MNNIIDFFSNLKAHEIVLWCLIVFLLVWEFIIQRRLRRPLEYDVKELKSKLRKLDFSAELSKKEIKELYKKMKLAEQEIQEIKRRKKAAEERIPGGKLKINKQHILIIRMIESTEEMKVPADLAVAYYLHVFKDKNRSNYTEVLGDLVEYKLVDLVSEDGNTYVVLTEKGLKSAQVIKKMGK
jgi:hypothetical protein